MKTTLAFRLIVFYATVATVTALATLWIGEVLVERQMIRGADLMLDAEFAEIELLLEEANRPHTAASIGRALRDHTLVDAAIFYFQVDDREGRPLFRSRNLMGDGVPVAEGLRYSAALKELRPRAHGESSAEVRVGRYVHGELSVRIATSLAAVGDVRWQFHRLMAVVVPAVFGLSLLVGYLLSQVMLRPLRAIQQTAQRIGANNLKERIPVPMTGDELSRLAELLNRTFDRIEKAFEQVRRFTADGSHELKTPLSIVRLQAEKLLDSDNLEDGQRGALRELLDEVARLERVINQLLLLAKAESETFTLERHELEMADYVDQFREDAETLAESEGRRFRVVINEPARRRLDGSWMRQVLFNLLSNAVKHTPVNGEIRFSSRAMEEGWRWVMEDDGPGVSSENLERIFDRFVKAGPAMNGTGLGLAVCRSVVELHGGRIRAERVSQSGGFRAVIDLPTDARE